MPRPIVSRRQWLAAVCVSGLPLMAKVRGQEKPRPNSKEGPAREGERSPIRGEARPGLERFDTLLREMLHKHRVPGGALCLAKDGRLLLAHGYGWANLQTREPIQPDMLFGIGSVSKAVTAVAALKLVEAGKLRLDERAFRILKEFKPPPGQKEDPRLRDITVRQLLQHTSGFEKGPAKREAARTFGVKEANLTTEHVIRYYLGKPLEFAPGTDARYSNFGYFVVGQIIEQVSGLPYPQYVEEAVFKPMGIRHAVYGSTSATYPANWAHRYDRNREELPPFHPHQGGAAGGWMASAIELLRFLTALDGTRGSSFLPPGLMRQMLAAPPAPVPPRKNGSHFGLGWDAVRRTPKGVSFTKNGGVPGYRAFVGHTADNVDWAVLFNGGTGDEAEQEIADTANQLQREIERTGSWPRGNLFPRYPG